MVPLLSSFYSGLRVVMEKDITEGGAATTSPAFRELVSPISATPLHALKGMVFEQRAELRRADSRSLKANFQTPEGEKIPRPTGPPL